MRVAVWPPVPGPWPWPLGPTWYGAVRFYTKLARTSTGAVCRSIRDLQNKKVPMIPTFEGEGGLGGYAWSSFEGVPPECPKWLVSLVSLVSFWAVVSFLGRCIPFGSLYPLYPFAGPLGLPCILFGLLYPLLGRCILCILLRGPWVFHVSFFIT
jgi:hypothetical protein